MKRILILLTACMTVLGARAQVELFAINSDAKSLGMGGVAMTVVSGSHDIFNNPSASLLSRKKMQLSGSYLSMGQDDYAGVSGFYKFNDRNLLQAGWRSYMDGYGDSNYAVDLGYSWRIDEKWTMGTVLRYFRYDSEQAVAANISAMCSIPVDLGSSSTVRLGGKIGNIGGFLYKDSPLSFSMTVGAALDTFITDTHEVTVAMDLGILDTPFTRSTFDMSIGAEYNIMQLFQFRAGYHYNSRFMQYTSLGVGVRFLMARVDLAYLITNKFTANSNLWGVSFGLDF